MKRRGLGVILAVLLILLFAAGCGNPSAPAADPDPVSQTPSINESPTPPQQESLSTAVDTVPVTVTRVVDGDTIEVALGGKTEKIRLIGVDTPETVHPTRGEEPYGREASNFTKTRLDGNQIGLEFDVEERDRYGRLLAYVWLGDVLFNEVLVFEGYAQVATYPPNVKYVDRFTVAQKAAREANRGLWGINPTTPEQPAATTGQYVGSLKSDKYHHPGCRHAQSIAAENEIWFQSKAQAVAASYKPCGVCKP